MLNKIPSTYRGMKRLKQISAVFIHHGFYDAVSRIYPNGVPTKVSEYRPFSKKVTDEDQITGAQRLRICFEELGPTFIKLGQMLSLEEDVIPPDFVKEFVKLQDQVPPFPYAKVQEIIESELGENPETLFQYIDPVPMAAASIAQVHMGQLFSGEKVVIKVQRPDIEAIIREDINILMRIARMMEKRLDNMDLLNPVAIVGEFDSFIRRELDFTNEAASIERFANNFKDDPTICSPKVFWDYTTPHVLVMEYLDGLRMDEKEKMVEIGLDPVKIVNIGLNAFAKQILDHGYFHADPHPGNSLVLPDGRVGLINFGIMGFIDQEMMQHLANVFVGYAEHDYPRLITVFMNMGLINDKTDLRNFKYDLIAISEPFYGRSLEHIQVKEVFDKMISLTTKYRVRLPRELILLFKTMVGLESIAKRLCPEANILETMKPYATRLLERKLDPQVVMGEMRHDIFNFANMFKNSPELMHKIFRNMAMGNQNINITLKIDRFDEVEKNYIYNSKRITVGIVAGTSAMAAAWVLASNNQFLPISIPFLGINNIPLTALTGLIGFSVATILGIWLAFTILFK